jgi:hypothetical protein
VKEVYFWLKISRIFLCSMHMAAWVGALVRAGHTGACPDVAPRAGLLHRSEEWVQLGDLKILGILGILRYYCYMSIYYICLQFYASLQCYCRCQIGIFRARLCPEADLRMIP